MILYSAGSVVPLAVFLSSSVIAIGKQKMLLINSLSMNLAYPVLKLSFIPIFGTISIGWIEAIIPYIILINFFFFLRNAIIPKLSLAFYLKFVFLIFTSLGLSIFALLFNFNIYIFFTIIVLIIIFLAYKFKFIDKANIPFIVR